MRGDVLHNGRYRLVEEVKLPKNQQGQGTAWLAIDTQSPRNRVLLRVGTFPNSTEEEARQAVKTIVTRLTQLSQQHPGFPAVVEVFNKYNTYYIVQPYPAGETLASMMQRQGGALPERDVAEYGRQICEMLAILVLQRPPMVHGAISPETIVVSPYTRQASLIYLPLFPPDPLMKDNASSGYMAPEQVRGDIKPSSDLYSLAATLHHAVTGFDPRERLIHFYPPARRLNPVVTSGMEAILARGLRLSIAQRYTNPANMEQDLAALISSYPPVLETPPPATHPLLDSTRPRQARRRNITLTIVAVCAALGLIFMALLPFLNNMNADQAARIKSAQQAAMRDELTL
ncbi:MAG: hypothetical protein J2P36_21535, partial [Ktedonobacteraceae bacterium]|nr:hypothetical protein [Ktedonobacteraceae bacterium]